MASYNASINLEVRIEKALSQIGKVEKALDRLSGIGSAGKEFKEALVPDTKKLGQLGKELDAIKNRANSTAKVFARLFEGIGTAGATAAGLGAINAEMFKLAQSTGTAAASIQAFDKNTGDLSRFIPGFTILRDSVSASAVEVNKLQYNLQQFLNNTEGLREFVQNFYTMEGAAGVATTGLLALAGVLEGQLRQSLGDIEQAGNKAFKGLQEDIANNTSELNRLINATRGTANQYRNLISLGEERRDSYNSSSREARQAINTIVRAEEKLTDELRAQADLKRAAKGITVTELEATKGRKSIETKESARDFKLKQLTEEERIYESIARLNERDGTALQQKLRINENILNILSKQVEAPSGPVFLGPGSSAGLTARANAKVEQERAVRLEIQNQVNAMRALEKSSYNVQLNAKLRLGLANLMVEAVEQEIALAEKQLEISKQAVFFNEKTKPVPIGGREDIPGSPAFLAAQRKRRREAAGNAIIGGAFPLLFGQGVGASVGGGLGGAAGGLIGGQFGFSLSLVGTAVGQAFDDLTIKAAAIGNALQSATSNMEGLREASISVTAELEAQVRASTRAGEAAKAQELIANEVAKQTGDIGGIASKGVAAQVNELQKAWDGVSSSVATLVGILAAPFVAALAAVLRLVQLIALGLNAAITAVGQLFLLIPGAKELGDTLYGLSLQGTEEYEKRQVALDKETEKLTRIVTLQETYNTGLERASSLRDNEFRLANKLLDYQQKAAESAQAIADKREELGEGRTPAERGRIGLQLFTFKESENKKLKQIRLGIERDIVIAQENNIKKINRTNEETARTYRDMRISIERQIEDERIKVARAVEDVELKKAKAVLDFRQKELSIIQEQRRGALEVNAALRQLQASVSTDPRREGLAAQLTTAVEQYKNGIAEASEKRAITEEKIRIDTLEATIQVERLRQDNARRIARLNEDSARKVADINTRIARERVESAKAAYDLIVGTLIARQKSDIGQLKATIAQNKTYLNNPQVSEGAKQQLQADITGFEAQVRVLETTITTLKNLENTLPKTPALNNLAALPKLTDLSAEISSAEKALNQYLETSRQALAIREEDSDVAKANKKLALDTVNLVLQQANAQASITAGNKQQIDQAQEYLSLLKDGVTPELAKQLSTIYMTKDVLSETISSAIEQLKALDNPELNDLIDKLAKIADTDAPRAAAQQAEQATVLANLQQEIEQREKIANYMKQMKDDLRDTAGITIQLSQAIETSLSTAISSAVQNLVTGAQTIEQTLSSMFESIGKAFIDMAAQIIAKQLVIITLQSILKALGGAPGGGGGKPDIGSFGESLGQLAGRANGGPVAPNTTYLVGERGPELLTMGSQGGYVHSNQSSAMDRYRNGGPAGTQTVNVNYSVTEINGMRFVTEDQFRAGMDQAARRGAKMGQTQTMSTLKNSRSQRSKIGL